MISKKSDCCTIIVTYNGAKWINNCLKSLLSSNYSTDILVIDNGSADDTLDILENFSKNISLIKINENLGFSQANNIGIQLCMKLEYEYLFLLNQDTRVEPNAISSMVKAHNKFKEFGIISPIHMNGAGTDFDKNFKKFVKRSRDLAYSFNMENLPFLHSPISVDFVNAAAWMVSRRCFETVGLFNPLFHYTGEDNNFCHRTSFKGLKIGVIKESVIYHDRENRNDIYSPTEDYKRELLKKFSNPLKNQSLFFNFLTAWATIIEISIKLRFHKIPGFIFWSLNELFIIRAQVKDFNQDGLYEFEFEYSNLKKTTEHVFYYRKETKSTL